MNHSRSPLIVHEPEQSLAWRQGSPISASTFSHDVIRLAHALPKEGYVLNLCDDRYRFMVGFAAAMQRGLITLMPPNRTPGTINQLLDGYPGSYCLTDSSLEGVEAPLFDFEQVLQIQPPVTNGRLAVIDPRQPAAILFTSGSTGQPKANMKCWFNLQREAASALDHFPFRRLGVRSLVATVPSQHMYGLATAVLFPWQGGFAVDSGRPFFPADIVTALERMPAPRALITTPLHLRACIAAEVEWPAVEFVISATAPLSQELAETAETRMRTQVFEIYGSTETGSVAGRHTSRETLWHLYDGLSLQTGIDAHSVFGGHVDQPVTLQDRLRRDPAGGFRLLGRDSDMVKIAGKRASLGNLTHHLVSIPGVEDGVFLHP